ncbi:MAG: ATP-binding protein [Bacteroidales bacterium]
MKELALHILDIVQNATRAGADEVYISITESRQNNLYAIEIADNGPGMSEDMQQKVLDPFFTTRTTRKVGLGLPLLQQNARLAGGDLKIESELGKGTRVRAWFQHDHIDRLPAGDLAGTLWLIFQGNPGVRFIYSHTTDQGTFELDTRAFAQTLGCQNPWNIPELRQPILDYLNYNISELGGEINTP